METTVEVTASDGPDKFVRFPLTGEPEIAMGMHGPLAEHYKAAPGSFEPHASTLDYVVGALAACLIGTLRRALIARGVEFAPEDLQARVTGKLALNETNVVVIESVEIAYALAGVSPDQHATAQRAHQVHERACPVSRTLDGAIAVSTKLEFV